MSMISDLLNADALISHIAVQRNVLLWTDDDSMQKYHVVYTEGVRKVQTV